MNSSIRLPGQVAIFTDFGVAGPYIGQMEAVLHAAKVTQPIYQLIADAPKFNPQAAAYLLASLWVCFSVPTVVVAVVDPGVGGDRKPILVEADGHFLVGPDNGLLSQVIAQAKQCSVNHINWRPQNLSSSFHGRDLFAPVAAMIARQQAFPRSPMGVFDMVGADWAPDLAEVIYIDYYGNAVCGTRATRLPMDTSISIVGQLLRRSTTFCDVPKGEPFWYSNSLGLVEIAVNQGRADVALGIGIGSQFLLG